MLKNAKKKQKFHQDRQKCIEAIENQKQIKINSDLSNLCLSFDQNNLFDTKMIESIENAPQFTDMRSEYSSNALNLQPGK
jgi:hypothetical protein